MINGTHRTLTLDRVNVEVSLMSITGEIDELTRMLSSDFISDDRRAFMVGALNALSWIRDGLNPPSQWLSSTPIS